MRYPQCALLVVRHHGTHRVLTPALQSGAMLRRRHLRRSVRIIVHRSTLQCDQIEPNDEA